MLYDHGPQNPARDPAQVTRNEETRQIRMTLVMARLLQNRAAIIRLQAIAKRRSVGHTIEIANRRFVKNVGGIFRLRSE